MRKGGTTNNTRRNEIRVAHTTQNSYWSKSMCPSIKSELRNTLDCERSKETGVEDLIDGHIDFDQLELCAVWATRISFLPVSLKLNGLLNIQVRGTGDVQYIEVTRKFVISIYATLCIKSMGQLTPEAQVQTTVLQYGVN